MLEEKLSQKGKVSIWGFLDGRPQYIGKVVVPLISAVDVNVTTVLCDVFNKNTH